MYVQYLAPYTDPAPLFLVKFHQVFQIGSKMKLTLPCLNLSSLTLEPMILMFNLASSLSNGAQQTQNLMHRCDCVAFVERGGG